MLHNDLKQARREAGLTMEEAAKELGISQSSLSRIEAGGSAVSSQRLINLARIYRVSPSKLMDGAVVRAMSDTDLDRIGQVIEFVEEVLSGHSPRPHPKTIRESVLAIFRQETEISWETGATFNPTRYRDLVKSLLENK